MYVLQSSFLMWDTLDYESQFGTNSPLLIMFRHIDLAFWIETNYIIESTERDKY